MISMTTYLIGTVVIAAVIAILIIKTSTSKSDHMYEDDQIKTMSVDEGTCCKKNKCCKVEEEPKCCKKEGGCCNG